MFVFQKVLFVFLEVLFVCFFQKVPSTETAVLIVRIKHLSARKTMIYSTLLPKLKWCLCESFILFSNLLNVATCYSLFLNLLNVATCYSLLNVATCYSLLNVATCYNLFKSAYWGRIKVWHTHVYIHPYIHTVHTNIQRHLMWGGVGTPLLEKLGVQEERETPWDDRMHW